MLLCVRYSDNSTGEEKVLKKKLSDAISIIQEQDKLIHQGLKYFHFLYFFMFLLLFVLYLLYYTN